MQLRSEGRPIQCLCVDSRGWIDDVMSKPLEKQSSGRIDTHTTGRGGCAREGKGGRLIEGGPEGRQVDGRAHSLKLFYC